MQFIADLSLNWQGLDQIKDMIQLLDASIVKFQLYSEYDLYGTGSKESKFKTEWLPIIHEFCKLHKKKMMVTVFNPDLIKVVEPYVPMFKIASSEITDRELINRIKSFKKPVMISCGGATRAQIGTAVTLLSDQQIVLMACNVEYPSKRHNVRKMLHLRNEFKGCVHGYSDHSLDIECLPILCEWYGAKFLEKHVKPNEDNESYEPHALTIAEFNEMVDVVSGVNMPEKKNPHQRYFDDELKRWVRPRV